MTYESGYKHWIFLSLMYRGEPHPSVVIDSKYSSAGWIE